MEISQFKRSFTCRVTAILTVLSLLINPGYASTIPTHQFGTQKPVLKTSADFVGLSQAFMPPVLRGVKFNPKDPLNLQFIIDKGSQKTVSDAEVMVLVRYFLAGLTTPDQDLWVNLSPNEPNRIIKPSLAKTELGEDMLEDDYMLKQLSSSLTYPETDTGKDYWARLYQSVVGPKASSDLSSFFKIWVTAKSARIYEGEGMALVLDAKLKAFTQNDYMALPASKQSAAEAIVKQKILPLIEQDVNSGKNFARVRQVYNSLILSSWFKKKFNQSFYRSFIDQGKVAGIDMAAKDAKERIYNLYLKSVNKGLYDYVKSESSAGSLRVKKVRYFSGGFLLTPPVPEVTHEQAEARSYVASERFGEQCHEYTVRLATIPNPNALDGIGHFANVSSARIAPVKSDKGNDFASNLKLNPDDFIVTLPNGKTIDVLEALSYRPNKETGELVPSGLDNISKLYWLTQYKEYLARLRGQAQVAPLIASHDDVVGNVKYLCQLPAEERPITSLTEIEAEMHGVQVGAYTRKTYLLEAGRGERLARWEEVFERFGRDISSKGMDLGYDEYLDRDSGTMKKLPRRVFVSESHLLQAIKALQDERHIKGSVYTKNITLPIVSSDSRAAYETLLKLTYFPDEFGPKKREEGSRRTYADILKELNIQVVLKPCPEYPSGDINTLEPTWERASSAGHGEWITRIFTELLSFNPNGPMSISIFTNGDGSNNFMPQKVEEWMIHNKVPMVMLTTPRQRFDKRFGMLMVVRDDGSGKKKRPLRLLERDSAIDNSNQLHDDKQIEIFDNVGLDPKLGEVGVQDGNTNTQAICDNFMAAIVQDVNKEVFGGDTAKMIQWFMPDLIAATKTNASGKKFMQFEGAAGAAMLALRNALYMSELPKVQEILTRHSVPEFKAGRDPLRLVSVPASMRTKYFNGLKYATDDWFYKHTERFGFILGTFAPEDMMPHELLPRIDVDDVTTVHEFSDGKVTRKYPWFMDTKRFVISMGKAIIKGLEVLKMSGDAVILAGDRGPDFYSLKLKGMIDINSNVGSVVNLRKILLAMAHGNFTIFASLDGESVAHDVTYEGVKYRITIKSTLGEQNQGLGKKSRIEYDDTNDILYIRNVSIDVSLAPEPAAKSRPSIQPDWYDDGVEYDSQPDFGIPEGNKQQDGGFVFTDIAGKTDVEKGVPSDTQTMPIDIEKLAGFEPIIVGRRQIRTVDDIFDAVG